MTGGRRVRERLAAGLGLQAAPLHSDGSRGPVPSRWTLPRVRASFPWLAEYSLLGVWQVLRSYGLPLRSGRVQA